MDTLKRGLKAIVIYGEIARELLQQMEKGELELIELPTLEGEKLPLPRSEYEEVLDRFRTDRPDLKGEDLGAEVGQALDQSQLIHVCLLAYFDMGRLDGIPPIDPCPEDLE